ncbi:response regulator transcription factor [Ruminococcus flavefaciens]|uniref:Stage 0 sporulation protein A homolog n=1 Tax=Ruminococcus flavefaciens TaxID=1265 RepID=A0A1M7M353_RUMFL|nr:response regulator transcription factor [Ruminococcus flavefaciens]SHM85089.1 DNA-binding response regulator, OmpR family, contains REC and winged-helix (wHTH) domain [Ruminococcus flavefaciens]
MSRIFIVEDDKSIREELAELLRNSGYEAEYLTDFSNSRADILAARPYLILMDINIPNLNGEQLLKEIRRESDIHVIMVTSRTSETDEVLAMSYGADDYITKPYNPTILLLRISAVLKRFAGVSQVQSYNGLQVNDAKGSLADGSREITLTKNEMIIFRFMLDRKGSIVTRDELMTALWDNDEFVNDNALTVNISRLRSKLADLGCEDAIETRKKQGYILR